MISNGRRCTGRFFSAALIPSGILRYRKTYLCGIVQATRYHFFRACLIGDIEKVTYLYEVSKTEDCWGAKTPVPHSGRKSKCLHNAAGHGHLEVVKWLVAQGFDVNGTDDLGDTVLDDAIEGLHFDIVEYLISVGADVSTVFSHQQPFRRNTKF